MEPTLTEVTNAIKTFVDQLVVIKENELLKPETLGRLDTFVNTFLDKAEVCLNGLDLCGSGDEQVTTTTTDAKPSVEPLVFLGLCLNIYGAGAEKVEDGHTDGLTFKIDIDGVIYTAVGSTSKNPIQLFNEMRDALINTPQPIALVEFRENGSPTNYSFTLNAKSPTTNFIGKKVVVWVERTEGCQAYFGNITVQGKQSPPDPTDIMQQFGVQPGVGYFKAPN